MNAQKRWNLVQRLKGEISYLCRRAADESWTHGKLFEHVSHYVYSHVEFRKLAQYQQKDLFSFFEGMTRGFDTFGLVKWRVRYNGELVDPANVPSGEWDKVKPGAFVWVKSGNIYSDSEEVSGGAKN